MKKIKKILSIVTFVFLFVFVLVSCNNSNIATSGASSNNGTANPTSTTTTPPTNSTVNPTSTTTPTTEVKLSEEEIKANFDNYVKSFNLSKASINKVLNDELNKANDLDISALLEQISLPNSSATVTGYDNGKAIESYSAYLWQKEKVIYLGYNQNLVADTSVSSAKIDLAVVESFVESLNKYLPDAKEDVDYVGMILEQMQIPNDFDVDLILSLIKFKGSDFDYSDGYFTLKKEKLVGLLQSLGVLFGSKADAAELEAELDSFGKFDFKLGYDGKHFTGFVIEYIPNFADEKDSSADVKVALTLNYNLDEVVGSVLDVVLYSKKNNVEILDCTAKVTATKSSLAVDAKLKANFDSTVILDLALSLDTSNNGLDLSVNGTVKVANTPSTDAEVYITYSEYKVDAKLALNESKLEFVLKINENNFADVSLVLNKYSLVSGTITLDANGIIEVEDGVPDKYVVQFTTKDVVIPESYTSSEAEAVDLIALITSQLPSNGDVASK